MWFQKKYKKMREKRGVGFSMMDYEDIAVCMALYSVRNVFKAIKIRVSKGASSTEGRSHKMFPQLSCVGI